MMQSLKPNLVNIIADDIQPDEKINPILRRADWRFLLANPQPDTSICFAPGTLAQAVRAISARVVDAATTARDLCDLAVAIDPDELTLRAMRDALKPGGACYTEWSAPANLIYPNVEKKLRRAGFEQIECYWAFPPPGRAAPVFWLPLAGDGALRYFMHSRPSDRNFKRDALRALLRTLWRTARAFKIMWTVYVVARKPLDGTTPRPAPTPAGITDLARANWERWHLGHPPSKTSWLVITGGKHSYNKVVGLLFSEPDPRPRVAVKMPRVPASVPSLLQEKNILEIVADKFPNVLGIPRILFCEQRDTFLMLGETALTGVPLYTKLNRANWRRVMLSAATWQSQLAHNTPPAPRGDWWHRLAQPMVDNFGAWYGDICDANMLEQARQTLASLDALSLVLEQRDFSPWNVLLDDDGQMNVIDWESAELRGMPGIDLIYFLTYANFFFDGAWQSKRYRESYQQTLARASFTGNIFSDALKLYGERIGLPDAAWHPLRVFCWMANACAQYERFRKHARGEQTLAQLRTSVFWNLWEEEMRAE